MKVFQYRLALIQIGYCRASAALASNSGRSARAAFAFLSLLVGDSPFLTLDVCMKATEI